MEPRILSVQSHVVSGYVGNKSAVFPMQLLGYDVDYINSVQFSNHTGYKSVKGQVITEKELRELIAGLKNNSIDQYTHLLTGYIGSSEFLKEIVALYKHLKSINPNLVYVCDPVMGDNGNMYVPKELLPVYKEAILPIATILVPNLYETQLLTNMKIESENDVWEAINVLHGNGIETVCVSSAELPATQNELLVFGSCRKGTPVRLKMQISKIPAVFTGTGDLFSALILCFMEQSGFNLKESIEKTVAALQAVLQRTYEYAKGKDASPRHLELRLIQSREDILHPEVVYKATVVEGPVLS
ncbi:pyridoxal kinase [Euwallacea similis]|uniref:pyridoxal kinase n=1 Tax=Euwallacea similis TaxID=1736056 RepID=UPI003450FAA3